MCILYVQEIASYQSEIENPNTSKEMMKWLKKEMRIYERNIQGNKLRIDRCETEIRQIGEFII